MTPVDPKDPTAGSPEPGSTPPEWTSAPDGRGEDPEAGHTEPIPSVGETATQPPVQASANGAASAPVSIGPAAPGRRWSGKRTAVVAAMAVGFTALGAAGAAAIIDRGDIDNGRSRFGNHQPGQLPGGSGFGGRHGHDGDFDHDGGFDHDRDGDGGTGTGRNGTGTGRNGTGTGRNGGGPNGGGQPGQNGTGSPTDANGGT